MGSKHILAARSLKHKRQQLILSFIRDKEDGFMHRYAQSLDEYFFQSFARSEVGPRMGISKNPYAIIALGGYGRQEQCIHSDVDVLFLFQRSVPAAAEELIREIVYPLWDIGLEVGYAMRSLKECLYLAGSDNEILTALLDARFVCGMSPLYADLKDQLHEKVTTRNYLKIIHWLIEKNRQRHLSFGDASYLLEPNLKEGQGGLRDYHTMMWIARLRSNVHKFDDLVTQGYLTRKEFEDFSKALTFIWSVRNRLHHLTGRKSDQLHFEYQVKLARAMKFTKGDGRQPVENFLGMLHGHMEFIKQQQLVFLYELGFLDRPDRKRVASRQTRIEGLEVRENLLTFASPEAVLSAPELILKIFEESVRLKMPLSAEGRRLIHQFSDVIAEKLRTSPQAVASFERILATPELTFNVLNEMLSSGFLTAFIPEVATIVNRIQYDAYHIYPVARHSLQTVWTVKTFDSLENVSGDPFNGRIYEEIKNKSLLLWAALLHDIGKGVPGSDHARKGAAIARDILNQKGLSQDAVETISFLIQYHLFLKETATRRDIQDEETAIFCARKMGSTERLKMLYLLSVADAIATGPKAWNDWTAAILKSFFLKVLKILEEGELASQTAISDVERKKQEILSAHADTEIQKGVVELLEVMSPRYLLYTTARDIRAHIDLYGRLEDADFIWNVSRTDDSDTRTVTVCAKDRPGFFSKVAGVFTLNSIDILDAQIYTWRNNTALDIFRVLPPPDRLFEEERWSRAHAHLTEALAGSLDLTKAVGEKTDRVRWMESPLVFSPHKVVVDNDSSSFFTIIEVFANDFPGLLFTVTDTLFRCGLDIWVAKIATKVDQVVDVFYVRDFDGQKIDSAEQIAAIQAAVGRAIEQSGPRKAAAGTDL
ncbi:MAG: [protein-PII] uridylyltransferase [Thermodesulfobacteriota bacterium]